MVAKELKKEIGNNSEISKDIDLLISQTKRCSEILKNISKDPKKSSKKVYVREKDKFKFVGFTDY